MAKGTIEVAYGLQWLKAKLADPSIAAAGSLGVWAGSVPEDQPLPAMVYGFQSGYDVYGAPALRLLTQGLFWVRAVGPSDTFVTLLAMANAVDALLEDASGTAQGTTILMCVREQPILLDMDINKVPYSAVGGLYRMQVL